MRTLVATLAALLAVGARAQTVDRRPAIGIHVHAYRADARPLYVCIPFPAFVPLVPGKGGTGLPAYLTRMIALTASGSWAPRG